MTDSSSPPTSPRLQAVIADIDAANALDPRLILVGAARRPREIVYSERMSECLAQLYPDASEGLRIAARAQHISRWQIARSNYPLGSAGYNAWRAACRDHHAALATAIMGRHGYTGEEAAHVARIIKKQDLKRDRDSQALENVAAVVFVRYDLDAFIAAHKDYSDEKLAGILRKTLRKMDAVGHAAMLELQVSPQVKRLLDMALT